MTNSDVVRVQLSLLFHVLTMPIVCDSCTNVPPFSFESSASSDPHESCIEKDIIAIVFYGIYSHLFYILVSLRPLFNNDIISATVLV